MYYTDETLLALCFEVLSKFSISEEITLVKIIYFYLIIYKNE